LEGSLEGLGKYAELRGAVYRGRELVAGAPRKTLKLEEKKN
jgi:hypothetical protein